MNQFKKKKLLYEVSIIRPLVIFLLVFLHSFQKISDGGGYHNDYQLVDAYKWIEWLISGFRIETIALVAGYVFSYQSHDLGRSYKFGPFVKKKFKRLIIPMLFFGVIYYLLFYLKVDSFSIKDFILQLLSGCGHLWFLPMLFWCFCAIWVIDRFKISSWWLLLGLAFVSIAPIPYLPLGFARLPHFIFYVFGGYFLWTKRTYLTNNCLTWPWIIIQWLSYICLVIVFHTVMPESNDNMNLSLKIIVVFARRTIELLMAVIGIMALYLTVCKFTTRNGFKPKQWVITASDYCYGVYVYHQFILVGLYFFTPLVYVCHSLLVPWIGFIIAMLVSLILTKLSLQTRFGRLLIG